MNDMQLRTPSQFDLSDAVVLVWGASYFVTAAVKPDLVGNVSPLVSGGMMAVLGALLVASVFLDSALLYLLLSLRATYGFVSSWTGQTSWQVPYSPAVAAVSMAAIDFVIAVVLAYKAVQSSKRS